MTWIVVVVGFLVVGIGLFGVVRPAGLIGLLESTWRSPTAYLVAIGVRVVLGIALWVAAPECRQPDVARALAVIALVAAIAGIAMGRARVEAFVEWWTRRPAGFVRGWALLAVAFGAYLIYTAT